MILGTVISSFLKGSSDKKILFVMLLNKTTHFPF